MKWDNLPINWFDIFVLFWLVLGILRGRKLGMSQELLIFLQWAAIVIVCAVTYQPLGDWLFLTAHMLSRLIFYIIAYVLSASLVSSAFVLVKRLLGGKLIGSDTFGKWEYYFGMPAGMLRFFCMLLTGLAVLNSRLYTPQEIQADRAYQMKNFDSEFFPKLYQIQAGVFEKSLSGKLIKQHLAFLLIKPTGQERSAPYKQPDWQMK